MHKKGRSGGFLGRRLEQLLKTGLPLMRNALKPLAKSALIPLGLTVAAAETDATIDKKNVWIRTSFGLSFAKNNINNFDWGNEWYHENGLLKNLVY